MVKCKKCGKEYELDLDDNPKDFQCDCGGNLEERRTIADVRMELQNISKPEQKKSGNFIDKTISDYRKDNKFNKSKDEFEGLNTEQKKHELFRRGYKLIDEDDEKYVFKKMVPVVPMFITLILAVLSVFLLLFFIGILGFILVVIFLFWKKPKIKIVKKDKKELELHSLEEQSTKTEKTPIQPEKKQITTNLIPCPSCGHNVSKKAKSCPNCGHPFD